MKKSSLTLLALLAVFAIVSCGKGDLAGTEWVCATNNSTISFESRAGGHYYYTAYNFAGEPYDAVADFAYHYDGNANGEMNVRGYTSGCIIDNYTWAFTVTGYELKLSKDTMTFTRK